MWRIQRAIDRYSMITGCQDICDFVNFGVLKIFETPKLVLKGNTSQMSHFLNYIFYFYIECRTSILMQIYALLIYLIAKDLLF